MVSEPLLWPFLSSLVFISVTSFLTTLPPLQLPSQPLAVEPPTSSSRRPWVPDLQLPLLRSFTLHRPLLFASPLQILLRLRFWRYHWDRPAPIYTLVEASKKSEIARAPTRRSKLLFRRSCAIRAPTRRSFFSCTVTCRHAPQQVSLTSLLTSALVATHCWRHLLASAADVIFWLWIWPLTSQVDRWLWLAIDRWPLTFSGSWLFQSRFSLSSFSCRFHFCCLFLHIVSLNG